MGIGPSTKETTLHHFNDPLLELLTGDDEIEIAGVVVAGISPDHESKKFIAERTASLLNAMNLDGAIVSMDSWGNSHLDFSLLLEQLGLMKIPTVGLCFKEAQEDFISRSRFVGAIIDTAKTEEKKETEKAGENTVTPLDARKALAMLKLTMKR